MSEAFVHPTAVIDAHVSLGEGVRIWHFVHVCEGARVGAGTSLGQNVFVGRGVRIGARVKVQNNVSLYEGVEIADDVFLGPSCVFTNVINPRAFVERKHAYRPTYVGRGASVGANATIVCGYRIGEYALVGAHATVTRDVPAYALVVGTPARRVGWVCRCGERLPSGERAQCAACGAAYRLHADRCEPLSRGEADAPREQQRSVAQVVRHAQASPSEPPRTAPATPMRVPLLDLQAQNAPLMPQYRAAFERIMASGQFILGPEVERFERALCDTFGFRHAVAVSSGTDALLLALMALEIGPGDEVITTPFSFFATAGCVARVGARPVFVDIDPYTYNLDPARVAAAITARTKAILPVHLFGQPAALDELVALAQRHGLALVEDAAQALGATYRGVHVGRFGQFGCFSFFPSKNLGGFGDGGLVTTEDATLAERARILRTHGGKPKYFHALVGGNFRLDALQAALLSVKLPALAGYTARRRAHAAYYDGRLAGLQAQGRLGLPRRSPEAEHVFNQYVIRTPQREALRAALSAAQIAHEIYYPRGLHLQACFQQLGYTEGDLPEAERACDEVLAIPVYAELSDAQRAYVADALLRFFEG